MELSKDDRIKELENLLAESQADLERARAQRDHLLGGLPWSVVTAYNPMEDDCEPSDDCGLSDGFEPYDEFDVAYLIRYEHRDTDLNLHGVTWGWALFTGLWSVDFGVFIGHEFGSKARCIKDAAFSGLKLTDEICLFGNRADLWTWTIQDEPALADSVAAERDAGFETVYDCLRHAAIHGENLPLYKFDVRVPGPDRDRTDLVIMGDEGVMEDQLSLREAIHAMKTRYSEEDNLWIDIPSDDSGENEGEDD
jgi:hypothetical protein